MRTVMNKMQKSAFALSITLWIIAALMAGSVMTLSFVKSGVQTVTLLEQKLQVQLRAENTFQLLLYYLKNGAYNYDYVMFDMPKTPGYVFPKKLLLNDSEQQLGEEVSVFLKDTGGLYSLMLPSAREISSLAWPTNPGNERVSAAAFTDWVDADSQPNLNGAESEYYLRKTGVHPRNRYSLQDLEELRLVRGFADMNETQWEAFSTHLHYGRSGFVNLMTLDKELLPGVLRVDAEKALSLDALRHSNPNLFVQTLYSLPGFDTQSLKFAPTKQVKIHIVSKSGNAAAHIEALVDMEYNFGHEITITHYSSH